LRENGSLEIGFAQEPICSKINRPIAQAIFTWKESRQGNYGQENRWRGKRIQLLSSGMEAEKRRAVAGLAIIFSCPLFPVCPRFSYS
jgi:hypothetical protein